MALLFNRGVKGMQIGLKVLVTLLLIGPSLAVFLGYRRQKKKSKQSKD
jgi:hypothetical protein